MSIDVRDLSSANVTRLTRLLSRRPEYGIAIPSRRWLCRQEEKLKSLPSELLRTSNPLKRLVIKIADSIDPNVIDPRAILCKTHTTLNPWLIRRLFLAVAYEVTVYTDTLRSWKGRKDFPIISALVGRIDAIAALWTEPDLYRECYGTPPFENHMVFVRSGCEACILSALGANARVLADLRSILVDRIERRSPRPDNRPGRDPRLARFVDEWIDHLKEERAAKCRAMSDNVLAELRATRSEVTKWRSKRKKECKRSKGGRRPIYTELKITDSGHQLSSIPDTSRYRRRTRNGIPVAMVDPEGAEEQRRMAMFSMTQEAEGTKSIFRPDSMCDFSQVGAPRMAAYDPTNSMNGRQQDSHSVSGNADIYDDYEEMDGEADFDRNLEEEEKSRSKVTDWYATRLAESHADLSADDARSVLSGVHPAFQPPKSYSHLSASPLPLRINKEHQPSVEHADNQSVWTDVSVHTLNPNVAGPDQDAPPVPRVSSIYNGESSRQNNTDRASRASRIRTPRPKSCKPDRPVSRNTTSSSVYSEQPPPSSIPPVDSRHRTSKRTSSSAPPKPALRKFLFPDASESGSRASATQSQYLRSRKGIRDFARGDNPFTREPSTPRPSVDTSTAPSLSTPTSRGNTVADDFGPPTPGPLDEAYRQEWGFPEAGFADDGSIGPDDSLTVVAERRAREEAAAGGDGVGDVEFSPWGWFARKR
ncbi:uncharacterized protein GGS22DRAFT_104704 [Annulohypoxylon maeteangense]|uniref:uncharacterized protein n=1 Tax=Annulohypoxylon maeteangense TaxID=1927788 RepID=UPI0020079A72|nr:uncharacterized protein GGS22DRAFT_104704 [Annulohypoxylon maeteangense]KAI0887119.1 hypothetical protein GGS22DRAFT_104704 [Annulohypoxylon maeteangense]